MTAQASSPGDGIVDSHHHFWDLSRFDYPWMKSAMDVLRRNYLPQDMIPLHQRNGVSQTVLVQAHPSVEEAEWLLELADANPFIGGVVAWVDLTSPDVGQMLDKLAPHPKLKGIRAVVQDEPDDDWLIRKDALRGLREVARHTLTYDVLVHPRHLKSVPVFAREVPTLRMVVDHIAKPLIADRQMEPWATDISAVASIPGIYCKISGMVTEADHANWKVDDLKPYVQHVVEGFGFDRIMFGSDWPVCLLAASYDQVLQAALDAIGPMTPEQRAKFLSGNARAFYRLD